MEQAPVSPSSASPVSPTVLVSRQRRASRSVHATGLADDEYGERPLGTGACSLPGPSPVCRSRVSDLQDPDASIGSFSVGAGATQRLYGSRRHDGVPAHGRMRPSLRLCVVGRPDADSGAVGVLARPEATRGARVMSGADRCRVVGAVALTVDLRISTAEGGWVGVQGLPLERGARSGLRTTCGMANAEKVRACYEQVNGSDGT